MKLLELGKDLVSLAIQGPFHGKWVGALILPFEIMWPAKIIFTKPATFTPKRKEKKRERHSSQTSQACQNARVMSYITLKKG